MGPRKTEPPRTLTPLYLLYMILPLYMLLAHSHPARWHIAYQNLLERLSGPSLSLKKHARQGRKSCTRMERAHFSSAVAAGALTAPTARAGVVFRTWPRGSHSCAVFPATVGIPSQPCLFAADLDLMLVWEERPRGQATHVVIDLRGQDGGRGCISKSHFDEPHLRKKKNKGAKGVSVAVQ